jgi:hypothetical protein
LEVVNAELPAEQLEVVNAELRRIAGDVGLSSPQVREVVALARSHDATPPTDEQQVQWQAEASNDLVRAYGRAGAEE